MDDRDVIFVLTKEDVLECVREMGISEAAITDDVLAQIKKGIEWGLECWTTVVKEAIRSAINDEAVTI